MFSRRLHIWLALGSLAALFAALVAVNARLSYRPVVVDFGTSSIFSPPEHLPILWSGNNEVWLLANTTGNSKATPPLNWKAAHNWNRARLDLMLAVPNFDGMATFCPAKNFFAHTTEGAEIEFWSDNSIRRVKERGHRNQSNVMKPGPLNLLSLSPDGKRVAASSHLWGYGDHEEDLRGFCALGLVVFDTQTGKQIARQSAVEGAFADVAWSPDSRQLAGITLDGWVFVFDGTTGKLNRKFRAHQWFGAQIAWSPDGKTLVTATNPRMALSPTHLEYALKSGAGLSMGAGEGTITNGQIGDKNRFTVAQAPNGDAAWNGRTERLLKRFDARTGTQIGSAVPLQTGAVDLQFSPDGSQIALGEHEFALILNAQTLATQRRLDIPKPAIPTSTSVPAPVCLAWSDDGATLATSTSRGLTLWRVR